MVASRVGRGGTSAQPSVRERRPRRLAAPLARLLHAVRIWIITAAQTLARRPSLAHQTSVDGDHLVPCDALSKSLIYKEINGPVISRA